MNKLLHKNDSNAKFPLIKCVYSGFPADTISVIEKSWSEDVSEESESWRSFEESKSFQKMSKFYSNK